jgi:mannosyltransferase OCH1-like enzyme
MIPKIIHYCWFGNGEISTLEKNCIASWKKYCPDYQIKLWNEENFNVNYCEFTKEAYRLGKYAFVSDVARLYALQQEGGVYLDTDMLLIKPVSDLLVEEFFIGDHIPYKIGLGIIGSVPNHPILNIILENYKNLKFNLTSPKLIPDLFDQLLKEERKSIKIYEPEFFYPLPFDQKDKDYQRFITSNSYAVHLWNHSWKDELSLLNEFKFISALYTYMRNRIRYSEEYKMSIHRNLFFFKFWLKLKVYLHKKIFKNK